MAIATAIEIEAGGSTTPGANSVQGAARGTGLNRQASQSLLSPTTSSADGFRSGLQSLLASLGSSMEDVSQTGANTDQKSTADEPALEEASSKVTVSIPSRTALPNSSASQKTGQGSTEASQTAKLSADNSQAEKFVARLTAGTTAAASARTTEKKAAAASKTESSGSVRSTHSAQDATSAVVSNGVTTEAAPEAIANLSAAASAPVIVNTDSQAANEQTVSAQTNLSIEAPNSSSRASFSWQSADFGRSITEAKPANTGGQAVAAESETLAQQGQVSSAASLDETSSLTFRQTNSSSASSDTSGPIAMSAADGSQHELPVSALDRNQTAEPNRNTSQIVAQSQGALQTLASGRDATRTVSPSQGSTEALTASQGSSQTLISDSGADEAEVSSSGSSQLKAADQNRVQASALSQVQVPTSQTGQGALSAASTGIDGVDRLSSETDTAADQSSRIAAPAVVNNPSYAGVGKATASGPSRSMHGTGNLNPIQSKNRSSAAQTSISTVDTSALAREVANAGGTVKPAGAPAGDLATATTGSESRDAFAALDAASAEGKATWIHSGTQQAEAGFQDPALGWVGVRANTSGGGVHAELVPGSDNAAQTLGSHLAGLNTYLAEHHTPVETLTMAAPESGRSGLDSGQSAGQSMQQNAGQQTGQELGQGADSGSQYGKSSSSTAQSAVASGSAVSAAELDGSAQPAWQSGHISVMA
jgi:hypothetical protein